MVAKSNQSPLPQPLAQGIDHPGLPTRTGGFEGGKHVWAVAHGHGLFGVSLARTDRTTAGFVLGDHVSGMHDRKFAALGPRSRVGDPDICCGSLGYVRAIDQN